MCIMGTSFPWAVPIYIRPHIWSKNKHSLGLILLELQDSAKYVIRLYDNMVAWQTDRGTLSVLLERGNFGNMGMFVCV